ncbi:MAG: hypothetical protein N2037_13995 [Acidimicrobiales bacterium]|nr:hypothetical protein [Acidimicrobiales bacterium]
MHFERLAIEAGDQTFTLAFHDRLTVIAGVGRIEREGLMNELIGALSSGRSGVHLEVRSDAGDRYAIFRPAKGNHRVVDVDRAEDVTHRFTDAQGRVNLLERSGLTVQQAKRQMCVTPNDLRSKSKDDELITALAYVEPSRLWDVARKVKEREAALNEAAEALGSRPEDAGTFEEIERRHQEFEAAQLETERVRHLSFLAATSAAMLSIPALVFVGTWLCAALLVAAMGVGAYSARFWLRMQAARRREEEALRAAGAHSYLAFQINRVNGLLANDHHRRQLMRAAADHRAAMAEWRLLAEDVSVEWALEHRREIEQAHTRLRNAVGPRNPMALTLSPAEFTAAEVGRLLREHLDRARTMGAGGESFPVFLDDAFLEVPQSSKPELLELLVKASAEQQLVYLTDDEDVASWARAEALTGNIAIVEPAASGAAARKTEGAKQRSRHVAA